MMSCMREDNVRILRTIYMMSCMREDNVRILRTTYMMSCMREDNVRILRTIIHDVMYERGQCQDLEDYYT